MEALHDVQFWGIAVDFDDLRDFDMQVMFVLFSVAAALWGLLLFRQRKHAHRLHYLFMVLVTFKALTLLSEAGMYHLIRITGHPEGWNIAFYVFNFMRGILFFTVSLAATKQHCICLGK